MQHPDARVPLLREETDMCYHSSPLCRAYAYELIACGLRRVADPIVARSSSISIGAREDIHLSVIRPGLTSDPGYDAVNVPQRIRTWLPVSSFMKNNTFRINNFK